VFGIWWLFVTVVVTSYCGNLVAFLTFPRMNPAVTTLSSLLKMKGTMTWGLLRGSALEKLLEVSLSFSGVAHLNRSLSLYTGVECSRVHHAAEQSREARDGGRRFVGKGGERQSHFAREKIAPSHFAGLATQEIRCLRPYAISYHIFGNF
jgi:Ligand-gated ion channel